MENLREYINNRIAEIERDNKGTPKSCEEYILVCEHQIEELELVLEELNKVA
jgi:hypothetical protein